MPTTPGEQLQHLLDGRTFEDQTFSNLALSSRVLEGKEFFRCRFEHCVGQESQWRDCLLEDVEFRSCDLTRATWKQVGLRGVRFVGSKLMGVFWSSVSPLPEVSFDECNLRYATFERLNLRKTPFQKSVVREANLLECDLSDADFSGSDLSGSTIRGCTLARADFSSAMNVFIDPAQNKVKDAHISTETAVVVAEQLGFVVGTSPPRRKK